MEEQVWAKIELEKLLSVVSETELFVIKNRLEGWTHGEIAEAVGRSRARVSQHEREAIRKMRRLLRHSSLDFRRRFNVHGWLNPHPTKPEPSKAETQAKWDALWQQIWG